MSDVPGSERRRSIVPERRLESRGLRRFLLHAALLCCALRALPTAGLSEGPSFRPPLEAGETEIALAPLPARTVLGDYEVTVSEPEDPEQRALGGSGGPLRELRISGPGLPPPRPTTIQFLWLFGRAEPDGSPTFSIWSKTGASDFVHCRLAWSPEAGRYCTAWCRDLDRSEAGFTETGPRRTELPCE